MTNSSLAFLFGAGASFGASASTGAKHVQPYSPPLMCELYNKLAEDIPEQWGPESPLASYAEQFRKDFETTFSEVILGRAPFTRDSLSLLERQRPLALYFSRFILDSSGIDYYSLLLRSLKEQERIHHSFFGALNYDCLFEQAADKLGLHVDYSCGETRPGAIRVAKIHGSCNFITQGIFQNQRAQMATPGVHYEVKVTFLPPIDVELTLKDKFSSVEPEYFPVMSQISAEKQHLVAPMEIQDIRNRWHEGVINAAVVVVIGVSYNINDSHILKTMEKVSVPILYIGGGEYFEKWRGTNQRFEYIHNTFEQGFKLLLSRLGVQPVADTPN